MGIRWGGVTESRHRARGQEQSMSVRQGEQSRGARKCGTEHVRLGGRKYGLLWVLQERIWVGEGSKLENTLSPRFYL